MCKFCGFEFEWFGENMGNIDDLQGIIKNARTGFDDQQPSDEISFFKKYMLYFIIAGVVFLLAVIIAATYFLVVPVKVDVTFEFKNNNVKLTQDIGILFTVNGEVFEKTVTQGVFTEILKTGDSISIEIVSDTYTTTDFNKVISADIERYVIPVTLKTNNTDGAINIKVLSPSGVIFDSGIDFDVTCAGSSQPEKITIFGQYQYFLKNGCSSINLSAQVPGYVKIMKDCFAPECKINLIADGSSNSNTVQQTQVNTLVVYVVDQNNTPLNDVNVRISQGSVLMVVKELKTIEGFAKFDNLVLGDYILSVTDYATNTAAPQKNITITAGNEIHVDVNLLIEKTKGFDLNLISEDGNACTVDLFVYDENDDVRVIAGVCNSVISVSGLLLGDYTYTVIPTGDSKYVYRQTDTEEFSITSSLGKVKAQAVLEKFDFKEDSMIIVTVKDIANDKNVSNADVILKDSYGVEKDAEKSNDSGQVDFIVHSGAYKVAATNDYMTGDLVLIAYVPDDWNAEKIFVQYVDLPITWKPATLQVSWKDMNASAAELDDVKVDVYADGIKTAENISCSSGCTLGAIQGIHAGVYASVELKADNRLNYVTPQYYLKGKTYNLQGNFYTTDEFGFGGVKLAGVYNTNIVDTQIPEVISDNIYYFLVDTLLDSTNKKVYYSAKNAEIGISVDSVASANGSYLEFPSTAVGGKVYGGIFEVSVEQPQGYTVDSPNAIVGLGLSYKGISSLATYLYNQRVLCTKDRCFDAFVNNSYKIEPVYVDNKTTAYMRAYNKDLQKLNPPHSFTSAKSADFTFDGTGSGLYATGAGYAFLQLPNDDFDFLFLQTNGLVKFKDASGKDKNEKKVEFVANGKSGFYTFWNKLSFSVEGIQKYLVNDENNTISFQLKSKDSLQFLSDAVTVTIKTTGAKFSDGTSIITLSPVNNIYSFEINPQKNSSVLIEFSIDGYVPVLVTFKAGEDAFYESALTKVIVPVPIKWNDLQVVNVSAELNARNLTNIDINLKQTVEKEYNVNWWSVTYADLNEYRLYSLLYDSSLYSGINGVTVNVSLGKSTFSAGQETISVDFNFPKSYLQSKNYFSIPVILNIITTSNKTIRVPVIFELRPQQTADTVIECDLSAVLLQNNQEIKTIKLDNENPLFDGAISVTNNADGCKQGDANVLGYRIYVWYEKTKVLEFDAKTDELFDNSIQLEFVDNIEAKLADSDYNFVSIYVPASEENLLDEIKTRIYTNFATAFNLGEIYMDVLPVFDTGIQKSYFVPADADIIYYNGVEIADDSAKQKIFSPVYSIDKPSAFMTNYISGSYENCFIIELDSAIQSHPHNYYKGYFNSVFSFTNGAEDKRFIADDYNLQGTITIRNLCGDLPNNVTKEIISNNDTNITEYTSNDIKGKNGDYQNMQFKLETDNFFASVFKFTIDSTLGFGKFTKYLYLNKTTNVYPEKKNAFLAPSDPYTGNGVYTMYYYYQDHAQEDGLCEIPEECEDLCFKISEDSEGLCFDFPEDSEGINGIQELESASTKQSFIYDKEISADAYPLCTPDEECYKQIKPDTSFDSVDLMKLSAGQSDLCPLGGKTKYKFNIEINLDSAVDCETAYCSVYQLSRYITSLTVSKNKMQVIESLKGKEIYLLDDNYSYIYELNGNSFSGLDSEPILARVVYGTNLQGYLPAGKYQIYNISFDDSSELLFDLKLAFVNGAVPSFVYKMAFDKQSNNVGAGLYGEYGLGFVFNNSNPYPNAGNAEGEILPMYKYELKTLDLDADNVTALDKYTILKYTPNFAINADNSGTIEFSKFCPDAAGCEDYLYLSFTDILTGLQNGELCYVVNYKDDSTYTERIYYNPIK